MLDKPTPPLRVGWSRRFFNALATELYVVWRPWWAEHCHVHATCDADAGRQLSPRVPTSLATVVLCVRGHTSLEQSGLAPWTWPARLAHTWPQLITFLGTVRLPKCLATLTWHKRKSPFWPVCGLRPRGHCQFVSSAGAWRLWWELAVGDEPSRGSAL